MKKNWNKFVAWAKDAYWTCKNVIYFRTDRYEARMDYFAFWEEINSGWYDMYIYPYDDLYHPYLSDERKLRLNQ
jgi:hypothetical protein